MNRNLIKSFWLSSALGSALIVCALLANNALAFFGGAPVYTGPIPNSDFKAGFVLARSVVLDPETGEPVLVEFAINGEEVAPVNIGDAKVLDLIVYPAADYRFQKQRLDAFIEQNGDSIGEDAEVMTRNEFEQAQFLYADNETQIAQDQLDENIKSVLVRAQKNRFVPLEGVAQEANEILVLLAFDVDLTQQIEITPQHQSLVLNQDGQVITASNNNIGYRVGFFGDPNSAEQAQGGRIQSDDTVYGPVPGARVYVDELVFPGSISNTASDGRYSFTFNMPPCPVGGFTYTTDVWAELRYKNFLPTGTPTIPYFLRTPGYSSCYAALVPAAVAPDVIGIQAATATPSIQSNLYVDVMFLTGRIVLKNSLGEDVPLGDTSYTTFEKPADYQTQQFYDFDGDGESDHVEQGRLLQCTSTDGENDTKSLFLPDSINAAALSGADDEVEVGYACNEQDPNQRVDQGGNWQGVYFAGAPQSIEDEPDLVRVIDAEFRDREIGVLKTISKDDMRNTDVYLFRESTGQLILERRGLKEAEAKYRRAVDYDQQQNEVAYRIMLRGNRDYSLNLGGGVDRRQSFEEWATDYQLAEPLRQREADHPRPGEFIKVVAINRATGYTGTARVKLQSAAAEESAGMLDVETPVITLSPPNLKIWAERDYEVEQGLTKGEERTYQIGNEGAALTSDTTIKLYTEWLDEEGRPLPEELGLDNGEQYGLTGRFAKVVGTNQLKGDATSSDLAEFAIAPGRNTQALRLKGQSNGTEHFYIHVIGKAKEQECVAGATCPSFDLPNNQAGLEGRPQLLTPFLTPLWDEDKHWQEFRAYRNRINELEEEFEDQEIPEDLEPAKPLPAYAWEYRPEYQFSQFELEVAELNRVNQDADGNQNTTNIINADTPTIASSDDYVEALYSLIDANFESLNPVDGGQELILALGEQEQRVTFGEDQTIRFDDVENLANLDVEDLLSLRLYSNNDAGNVLWEYAFLFLSVGLANDEEALVGTRAAYVSADKPEVEISSLVVGYSSLSDEAKLSFGNRISWRVVSGSGHVSPSISEIDQNGSALTNLSLSPFSGNSVVVEASLIGDQDAKARLFDIRVIAGSPHQIIARPEGNAFIRGKGEVKITAEVYDKNSNLVEDGHGVDFRVFGHTRLKSETMLSRDGIVEASVIGGSISGTYPLKISSGTAESTVNIPVQTLNIDLVDMPEKIYAGDKYDFGIRVSGTQLSLDNILLDLGVSNGTLNVLNARTNVDGIVRLSYLAPSSPGSSFLGAKVDLGSPKIFPIDVLEKPKTQEKVNGDSKQIFLEKALVVASEIPNFENQNSEDYLGNPIQLNYTPNKLNISGTADTEWQLDLEDYFFPNREPIYFSRFKNLKWDELRLIGAEFDLVNRIETTFLNLFALEFIGSDSFWRLNRLDNSKFREPSYNFHLKLKEEGQVLDVSGGAINLDFKDGRVFAELKTSSGTFSLNSKTLELDDWIELSVGVRNEEFYLGVDGDIERADIGSADIEYAEASPQEPWLQFGKGFMGQIAGFRIYDWSSSEVLIAQPSSGRFDSSGRSEVQLSSIASSSLRLSTMTYRVSLSDESSTHLNLVNRSLVSQFSKTYAPVKQQYEISDDQILSQMKLDGLFPEPNKGLMSLVRGFSSKPNIEAARPVVITTLAWASHDQRYAFLGEKVSRLQRYFTNSGNETLTQYAAEYFYEAIVEANNGNPALYHSLSTSLVVWAELIEVRPDLARSVANSIKSTADFWTWVRVMSLPARGWVTDVIPIPDPETTCDQIVPDINSGTLLQTSLRTCRATGGQMAFLVNALVENDESIGQDPGLLTVYVTALLASLEQLPYEFKTLFPDISDSAVSNSESFEIKDAHAAGPAAPLVLRGLLIGLRQALRKGLAGSANNFVAFMQGGTTSRVTREEMLIALAYLGSRVEGSSFCFGCEKLNEQVSETVILDIATWYAGLGLSKDGIIKDPDKVDQACTLTANTHGKAFELVATAAYHALFEFGGKLGIKDSGKYEILLSDPRSGRAKRFVPLMKRRSASSRRLVDYEESPYQRKPDLVLAGKGEGARQWIELKSWRFDNTKKYLTSTIPPRVNSERFPKWNGKTVGDRNFRKNAHRQHMLDIVASQNTLIDEYWEDEDKKGEDKFEFKPSAHKTWMQVWKSEKRTWFRLVRDKNTGKYRISKAENDKIFRNTATPWIDSNSLITRVTPRFKALQRYFSEPNSNFDNEVFEVSFGISKEDYIDDILPKKISPNKGFSGNETVLPFNIATFFSIEAGSNAKDLFKSLYQEFASEEFSELQAAVDSGELSEEEIERLREKITEKAEEVFGPLKYIIFRIPFISDLEDDAADYLLGEEIDEIREFISNKELPGSDFFFENVCELN